MSKDKGPGAPYGNKNAAGPHRGSKRLKVMLVKGGNLIKHPRPSIISPIPRYINKKPVVIKTLMGLVKYASAVSKSRRDAEDYRSFVRDFIKKNGRLKLFSLPRPKRKKR